MAKKKEINPELEQKAMTAFAIATELEQIVSAIIEAGGECNDDQLAMMQRWQAQLEIKAQNIAMVKARLESEQAYFKAIEEAARNQRKAREAAVERLTKYLAKCMQIADVKSLKSNEGLFSVSLVAGRPKAVIDNPGLLPADLVEVIETLKPKGDEILSRLKDGKEVSGASLEYGEPFVTIRGGK